MEGDAPELKGGHPPAVKVGGMRVVQKKDKEEKSGEASPSKMTAEDKEEFGEDRPEKRAAATSMIVSGAKNSEADAFPKEAVKAYHDKPQPKHEQAAHSAKPKIIQQPKK